MSMREKEVLNMQLFLIPILADAWKKTYSELSDIFKKYDVLSYIDVCYENYNSTGNQGARIKRFEITDKIARDFFVMFCRGRKDDHANIDDSWKDRRGLDWYYRILEDGSQLWVTTRNGIIQDGGLNNPLHLWDERIGLSYNIF